MMLLLKVLAKPVRGGCVNPSMTVKVRGEVTLDKPLPEVKEKGAA